MEKLAKILIILASICLLAAMVIKLTTVGRLVPAATPINWAKLTDTVLLFSIAFSLLAKK